MDELFIKIKQFYTHNKRFPSYKKARSLEEKKMAKFLKHQRYLYNLDKLPEQNLIFLKNLNFSFNVQKDNFYNSAKLFMSRSSIDKKIKWIVKQEIKKDITNDYFHKKD